MDLSVLQILFHLSYKTMKRISSILALLVLIFTTSRLQAQEVKHGLTWYTDVNQVYELSVKSKKPIFAFFTGSDWCGWCNRLEANVFDKPGFQAWAKNSVILLELDFPRRKKLPEALARQNSGLQQFFQVQGYPTIWIFNMAKEGTTGRFNIAPLGSLGYPESKPGKEETAFLDNVTQIMKQKKKS
jgi:protein disulfide-isomerase